MTNDEGSLRRTKAGARRRRRNKAARRAATALKVMNPYQSGTRGPQRRARVNRKAERFDVDEGRGWIVIRAEAGRYRQCADGLRTAGCPVFEARQEVRVTTGGKARVMQAPMMGRLLFVGVDAPEQACMLLSLDYVERVFCRGEGLWFWADYVGVQSARPAVISPKTMQLFADNITGHRKGDKAVGEFVEAMFKLGDRVRVSEGPFASFFGTIEEIDTERTRLKVGVSMFGRAVPVELEEKQVEAA